ncbi:hypothetical protein HQ576_15975, partial [bacterium]|nr:hypothetical protein [bacterium]
DFDLQPAQHVPFTLVFRDRELMDEGPHDLSLALSLRKGDRTVFAQRHRYELRARAKQERAVGDPTGRRVALYEGPQRKLRQALRSAGARVEIVRDLRKLPDVGILVIGPHALDGLAPSEGVPTVGPSGTARDALSAFVRNGGAVLVLEQDSYDCGLLPARLIDRACSVGFQRNVHWTVFCRLYPDDLRFWRGDHVVARKTIAKPTHGRFRALSDSGGPAGLTYLPALEVLDGKGSYVLSQFLIGEKLGTEPAAQLLLEGLLRYSVIPYGSDRRPETSTVGIIQNALALGTALDEVDAVFIDLSGKLGATDLSAFRVLLAEADAPEVTQHLAKLREFVEAGGTLVLHAGTRAGIARLQRLFPEKIVAQPNTSVPVNINRAERHDLVIAGLTNQELYWYGDRNGLHWRVRTPLSAEVCDHVILGGLPDAKTCQTYEAEKMAEVHGTPSFRESEVYMHRNAAIKTAVDVPKDGEYALIIRGRGTPVAGAYPQIAIEVDGKRVGSLTAAGEEWGECFLTTKVAKGKHEVTLAFVNDAWDPVKNEDRNVSLDWLRVGPVRPMKAKRLLNPPALVKMPLGKGFILLDQVRWDKRPGDEKASRYLSNILTNLNCDFHSPVGGVTLQGGDLTPAKGAKLWQAKGGIASLGTNGTLSTRVRFAKAGKVAFAIRAEGTQALGEWPNIAVAIDGKKLGDVMLRRAGWHTVRLEAAVAEGEHEVALSFTNDYYDDTQEPKIDRNLRIGELRIR